MGKQQDLLDLDNVTESYKTLTGHDVYLGITRRPNGQVEAWSVDPDIGTITGVKAVLAHARKQLIAAERMADPRLIDDDGFLLHSKPGDGPFGCRRGFGGLSSAVGSPSGKVGIVTAMITDPTVEGLLLHVVWLPAADPAEPVPDDVRATVIDQVVRGHVEPDHVAAYGLLALDI